MTPFEIASLALSGIQALSATVATVKPAITGIYESRAPVRRVFRTNDKAGSLTDYAEALVEIADPDIIQIIADNINRAVARLKDALADPSLSQAGKTTELEIADHVICTELSRIAKLNGGILPNNVEFRRVWKQHRCEEKHSNVPE